MLKLEVMDNNCKLKERYCANLKGEVVVMRTYLEPAIPIRVALTALDKWKKTGAINQEVYDHIMNNVFWELDFLTT